MDFVGVSRSGQVWWTWKMQYQPQNLSYHIYLLSGRQFVSDVFDCYSKICCFWRLSMYSTRDFGADIAFSGSTKPVPTWKHQQNPSGVLVLNISILSRSAPLSSTIASYAPMRCARTDGTRPMNFFQ